jgi:hypothetical protein
MWVRILGTIPGMLLSPFGNLSQTSYIILYEYWKQAESKNYKISTYQTILFYSVAAQLL